MLVRLGQSSHCPPDHRGPEIRSSHGSLREGQRPWKCWVGAGGGGHQPGGHSVIVSLALGTWAEGGRIWWVVRQA